MTVSAGIKQILVVEPEPVLAEITAFRLELLGYRVETVASAEDAFGKIGPQEPDLLITDLELPGLTGLGFIERLASGEETSDLPIIALLIKADLDHVQTAYEIGASDFLVVPFQPEVLEEKVQKHLARTRSTKSSTAEQVAR